MKNLIGLVLLASLFASCSSTQKVEVAKSGDDGVLEEFIDLENKDFAEKKEIPFIEERDVFSEDFANIDSLSRESAARLPAPRLQALASEKEPLSRIVGLCYQGKFEEAFNVADKGYQEYKEHPNYWSQLGTCYFIQKNYRKALIYYNKARGINDKYVPPINNIGVIYQSLGMDQKALLSYQRAYELNAFSATPAYNLGQLYLKYGFLEDAEKIFLALRNKNNSDVDVNLALANVFLFKGDAKRAISLYSSIDKRLHREPVYGLNYAIALKIGGRPKDATTVYKNINSSGLGELSSYYSRVGEFVNR